MKGDIAISEETHELVKKYTIACDDLYVTIAGTIGAVGEIPKALDGMNLTENAAKIVFRRLDKNFVKHALASNYVQAQFLSKINQMAQPKLALHRIGSSVLAMPPLKEQHRIVSKVDELMAICDQLKTRLNQASKTRGQMADAVVEQALH
jgi:type I restriction enzyme S subunit